ncbi:putative metal-binding motif-containing protein [Candidatus Woesearchaeota archaeon]|nr:putative metal-binding motif-containing protein [Candidatus Woesearchaeota archaeon]
MLERLVERFTRRTSRLFLALALTAGCHYGPNLPSSGYAEGDTTQLYDATSDSTQDASAEDGQSDDGIDTGGRGYNVVIPSSLLDIHILSLFDTQEDDSGETNVSPGYDPENCPDGNKNTWCADRDGDGFGNKSENKFDCFPPPGEVKYTKNCGDCNDKKEINKFGVYGADVYPGAVELCNLVDDDCDGKTDEDLLEKCSTDCGPGYNECISGQWVCDAPLPTAEICDGYDNDCNNIIDDSFPITEEQCGPQDEEGNYITVGVCKPGVSVTYCDSLAGKMTTTACDAFFPQGEICDNYDNDCDGKTDEDFMVGELCYVGIGECVNKGQFECLSDLVQVYCDAMPKDSGEEICDGKDNDCDGQTDEYEDIAPQLESIEELCASACGSGDWLCIDGQISCSAPLPKEEICNGYDDDCDKVIDNGYNVGQPCTLGAGACMDIGEMVCTPSGLSTICNAAPGKPEPESCDGVDNDCDLYIDELPDIQFQLDQVFAENGICQTDCGPGEYICFQGSIACNAPEPGIEVCNGLDDDCDGLIDEDYVQMGLGKPCEVGIGACYDKGNYVCTKDGKSIVCNAVEGQPLEEMCNDHVDNDCDGLVDEDCCDDAEPIKDIVPCKELVLYFKIDDTGSMAGAIYQAGQLSKEIGTTIFSSVDKVNFGLGTFKDTEGEQIEYGLLPYDEWKVIVQSIKVSGGGDAPESSLNSLYEMLGQDWADAVGVSGPDKVSIYAIHMTDAAWHKDGDGTSYSTGLTISGTAQEFVAEKINYIGISFSSTDYGLADMALFESKYPEGSKPTASMYKFYNSSSTSTLAGIVAAEIMENEPLQSWTQCIDGKYVQKNGICEQ